MSAQETPPRSDSVSSTEPSAPAVSGIWLMAGPVREPIQGLLLDLLSPNQPNPGLAEALVEELGRPVKKLDVALEYLGLRRIGLDGGGVVPLPLVATKRVAPPGSTEAGTGPVARSARHPWGRVSARVGGGHERPRSRGPRPRGVRSPGRRRARPRQALRGHGPRGRSPRDGYRTTAA